MHPYRKLQLLLAQLHELAGVSVILFKTHFFPQNYPLPLFMLLEYSGHQYHFLSSQLTLRW